MVSVTGYSYPWDYRGDEYAAPRARDLGLDAVALAASYHAARVASPLHPSRQITDVPYSAMYAPFRPTSWQGHRLIPRPAEWLGGENAFLEAQRALAEVGLPVDAWLVLTHYDDAGLDYPDLVVRNAFDEPYGYALCPSSDAVREYCLTLVDETLATTECRGVVLEACGPMGLEHGGVHDKLEFATYSATDERLLALCFCAACRVDLLAVGVDADDLARRVREGVGAGAPSVEDVLGDALTPLVTSMRVALSTELRTQVVARVRAARRNAPITVHASADPWATGSFPASGSAVPARDVTTLVANCWSPASAPSELRSLRSVGADEVRLGGYLRVDQGWDDRVANRDTLAHYANLGMNELHLYHLGLISNNGLATAHELANLFRESES